MKILQTEFYIAISGHNASSIINPDELWSQCLTDPKSLVGQQVAWTWLSARGGRPVVRQSTNIGSLGEAPAASAVRLPSIWTWTSTAPYTPNLTHVWNKERRSWTLMHVSGPTHTPSHRRMLAQLCIMFLHSNIYSLEVVLLNHKRPIEQHILLSMALIGSALHIYDYQHYSSYRVKSCNV